MERIEKLNDFLKQSPADSFLQHALALEYIKLGNDVAAESLFAGLLNREPGYIGSYYHLAKLLERNDKTEEAIKSYLQPDDLEIVIKIGDQVIHLDNKDLAGPLIIQKNEYFYRFYRLW